MIWLLNWSEWVFPFSTQARHPFLQGRVSAVKPAPHHGGHTTKNSLLVICRPEPTLQKTGSAWAWADLRSWRLFKESIFLKHRSCDDAFWSAVLNLVVDPRHFIRRRQFLRGSMAHTRTNDGASIRESVQMSNKSSEKLTHASSSFLSSTLFCKFIIPECKKVRFLPIPEKIRVGITTDVATNELSGMRISRCRE